MDDREKADYERMLYYLPSKMKKAGSKLTSDYSANFPYKDYYFPVLQAIYYQDGVSQKEIVRTVAFDKSRISVIVNELIEQGFVTDSGEGRTSCLHLTDKGKQANTVGRMYSKIFYDKVFSSFNEEELKAAADFFIKLDKVLDEIISDKE